MIRTNVANDFWVMRDNEKNVAMEKFSETP